jgi:hypothetical protein
MSDKKITTNLQAWDIGGHLDTTLHCHNKIGTDRMEAVIQDIRSHANIPSHPHSRYRIVISKYLPAALYAISTSPENIRSVNRLMSAIADFLLGKNPLTDRRTRSTILAMYTCGTCPHTTCDPWRYILRQRCIDFRRCYYITPRSGTNSWTTWRSTSKKDCQAPDHQMKITYMARCHTSTADPGTPGEPNGHAAPYLFYSKPWPGSPATWTRMPSFTLHTLLQLASYTHHSTRFKDPFT